MSHSHDHSYDHSSYYLEQLCSIVVCGALGLVVVLLYFQRTADQQKVLGFLLAKSLHPYLLGSGIAILSVAALRAGFLAFSLRRRVTRHADNQCGNCGHQHDHDYRWSPLRYLALCLPIMLFLLGMPNQGFKSVKAVEIELPDRSVADKPGGVIHLDFLELYNSAQNPAKREYLEGRTGVLKGQLAPGGPGKPPALVRFKSTCCPADAIPFYVAFLPPESITDLEPGTWVEVTGQIQYAKRKGLNQSIPVLKVRSHQDIAPTPQENPYYLE